MTREEEIDAMARCYTDNILDIAVFCKEDMYSAYVVGAMWADSHHINAWHDASEEPQDKNKQILSYSEDFDYFFIDFPNYLMVKDGGQNKNWETAVLRNKISKWAYLYELLPKKNE